MFGRWAQRLLAAGAIAVALAAGQAAQAGMIPVSVSVQPDGSDFRWTYGVIVTTNVSVKPGDSFTIYDVGGMLPGTIVAPTGWSETTSNVTTPPAGLNPIDNPSLPNLTFTYNGASDIPGSAGLGNFSVISQFNTSATGDFTSTTHRQLDGVVENNITTTNVPSGPTGPPNQTPEPATIALLGLALPALGLSRLLRKRRQLTAESVG
jgi:hypothetical protein